MNLVKTPYPPLMGRPLYVETKGKRVYILFHDHYYLKTRQEFLEAIFHWHPDRNRYISAKGHTRKLIEAFHKWQEKEERWYAQCGLVPPRRKQCLNGGERASSGSSIPDRRKERYFRYHWIRWGNKPRSR